MTPHDQGNDYGRQRKICLDRPPGGRDAQRMTRGQYCIVGAGAAGLATLQVMRHHGVEVDCFEATDRVAGHWNTDYDALHLITSRNLSGFDGYPMPETFPTFPSRDQMRAYQESFARHFGLLEHIHFGEAVVRAEPLGNRGDKGWRVETAKGRVAEYDALLVANGHLWDPYIPEYEGTFTGRALHSSRYRNAGDAEGRVLVVGAGNSGCDLAADVAAARFDTCISMRRGQMFQPKSVFGRPRAELAWLARLPARLQERVSRGLAQVTLGDPSSYPGLPIPATRNLNRQPPVVNNLLLYWIQHGRISVVPGIRRFDGADVEFTDGTVRTFDTLLWATGFRVTFPFLDRELFSWRAGVPLRTAGMTTPVGVERLFLIGLADPRGGQLPVYSAQAKLIARFLDVLQRSNVRLAGHFAQRQTPDNRIDIVRREWNQQMCASHAEIDRLLGD